MLCLKRRLPEVVYRTMINDSVHLWPPRLDAREVPFNPQSRYLKRVRAWTGQNDAIIANAYCGAKTLTIAKTDVGFTSRNCGNWTLAPGKSIQA